MDVVKEDPKQQNKSDRSNSISTDVYKDSGTDTPKTLNLELAPREDTDIGLFERLKRKKKDLDSVATQESVFDDPVGLKAYAPREDYENVHRFDPNFRWTWREEKGVTRKIDIRIMIWVFIMFFSLDLDRTNLQQANTDNFLDDLGLNTNDYNLGNSLFRAAFLCAELPSQLVSKAVGPDRWIPAQMTMWSIVALCQFWLSGRSSFLACRFLLGFIQGGFIPDVILYLSYFYTKYELPLRLAFFWISNNLCEIVSGLLATGLLRLRGHHGYAGWRWLFLIEGCLTLAIGLASFFMMPSSPTHTKTWFRPKGYFTEREEYIMTNRILRDDPMKGKMHNRQRLTFKMLLNSLLDYNLWPMYLIGFLFFFPVGPTSVYLTLTLRRLGFNTTDSNLLSIPAQVVQIAGLLTMTILSEKFNNRTFLCMVQTVWAIPLLATLLTFSENTNVWAQYVVSTLIAGYPYVHVIQVAWVSRNSNAVSGRTVSAAVYNMCVQAGGIAYNNVYRESDKPMYYTGNKVLISIACFNVLLYLSTFTFYRWQNKRRDKIWNAMSEDERNEYIATTKDQGSKRLEFRFAY